MLRRLFFIIRFLVEFCFSCQCNNLCRLKVSSPQKYRYRLYALLHWITLLTTYAFLGKIIVVNTNLDTGDILSFTAFSLPSVCFLSSLSLFLSLTLFLSRCLFFFPSLLCFLTVLSLSFLYLFYCLRKRRCMYDENPVCTCTF